eukprot:scaffold10457_cov106-Isochrysis_galbana.AAC.5
MCCGVVGRAQLHRQGAQSHGAVGHVPGVRGAMGGEGGVSRWPLTDVKNKTHSMPLAAPYHAPLRSA